MPMGLYQWKILPVGIKTSGAFFQRLINSVLGDLHPKIAIVYIDNITILSPTLKQYHEDVDCFLERLSIANLKVSVDKCAFACGKVDVLGFKVLKDGTNPNPAKVQGISDLKLHKTCLGLNKFWECLTFTLSLSQILLR